MMPGCRERRVQAGKLLGKWFSPAKCRRSRHGFAEVSPRVGREHIRPARHDTHGNAPGAWSCLRARLFIKKPDYINFCNTLQLAFDINKRW